MHAGKQASEWVAIARDTAARLDRGAYVPDYQPPPLLNQLCDIIEEQEKRLAAIHLLVKDR